MGCLLLIACVNIANLLLARASARQREFAVRMALGAGPAAIFRQFLAESLLLCLVGAGLGCLLAIWGTQAFKSLLGGNFAASTPGWQAVSLCIPVLCFTIAISILCALFFTVVPARLVTSSLLGNATNLGERSATSGRAIQKHGRARGHRAGSRREHRKDHDDRGGRAPPPHGATLLEPPAAIPQIRRFHSVIRPRRVTTCGLRQREVP